MQCVTAVRSTKTPKLPTASSGDGLIHKMRPGIAAADGAQLDPRHVLLAEDEPVVRMLMQGLLRSWGYLVFSACNGREALEMAGVHEGPIDLLISDVTMPEMNGPELAEKLKAKRPTLQVILMSGYSQTEIVLQRGWRFVQKPFQIQDLRAAVGASWNPRSEF